MCTKKTGKHTSAVPIVGLSVTCHWEGHCNGCVELGSMINCHCTWKLIWAKAEGNGWFSIYIKWIRIPSLCCIKISLGKENRNSECR